MFVRPSLQELRRRTYEATLAAGLDLPISDQRANSNAIAAVSHMLLSRIESIGSYIFPDSENLPTSIIERHAGIWGVVRRPPSNATGEISIETQGVVNLPKGTALTTIEGIQYETRTGVSLSSDDRKKTTIKVRCQVPGRLGNLPAGERLSFVSPAVGLVSEATVISMSGGQDKASDLELVEAILERIQERPAPGSARDLIRQIEGIDIVQRGFVFEAYELGGQIGIAAMVSNNEGTFDLASEAQYKDIFGGLEGIRPIGSRFVVAKLAIQNIKIEIRRSSELPEDKKLLATEALKELFNNTTFPTGSYARAGESGVVTLAAINEAIARTTGTVDYTLIAPKADIAAKEFALMRFGGFDVKT